MKGKQIEVVNFETQKGRKTRPDNQQHRHLSSMELHKFVSSMHERRAIDVAWKIKYLIIKKSNLEKK
jgi:hypothetical protein